jgi:protein TIF31
MILVIFSFLTLIGETVNDSVPTYQAVNGDLRGIQKIEKLDQEGLYTLATCIINYVGRKLICQSIIPGILSFVT